MLAVKCVSVNYVWDRENRTFYRTEEHFCVFVILYFQLIYTDVHYDLF